MEKCITVKEKIKIVKKNVKKFSLLVGNLNKS